MKKMTIVYSFWYSSFFKNARCNFMTCFFKTMACARRSWTEGYVIFGFNCGVFCDDQIGFGHNLVVTVIAALRMGLHSSAITFERGTDGHLAHMSRYTVCSIMA